MARLVQNAEGVGSCSGRCDIGVKMKALIVLNYELEGVHDLVEPLKYIQALESLINLDVKGTFMSYKVLPKIGRWTPGPRHTFVRRKTFMMRNHEVDGFCSDRMRHRGVGLGQGFTKDWALDAGTPTYFRKKVHISDSRKNNMFINSCSMELKFEVYKMK
ncbi:hypothetical protein Fmac_007920 [Flemingia macrophylla]|uniref:Uncharacterized protein n=1 Tax=Flemingia macrophylla TaxID=520843 RepID=A0ABD1MYA4_9FABA